MRTTLLIALLFLTHLTLYAAAPSDPVPLTPIGKANNDEQPTATAVPRVPVVENEDFVQPPADGPSGDDMGMIPAPKQGSMTATGTITPIDFETMQSTLTALMPSPTTPVVSTAATAPLPTLVPIVPVTKIDAVNTPAK